MTRRFKRNATQWNQSLELLSKGWGVVAGATRAAAAAIGAVTREAAKLDTAVREVATIADAATLPMAEINRLGKDLSTTFGGSATDQVKGLYQAVSAGAQDAGAVMHAANQLAIGGVTDVTTAIDGLTTVMNAWGQSAGSATDVADTFFVAIKAGKTTAAELSSSIGAVASSASAAGVPVEELAAAAATLTTKGIATAEAMTSLRGVFAALGKDKKTTAAEAKRLGVEFSQAALRAKGLKRFLLDIVEAEGVTEKSLTRLFGRVEATNAVLALTAEGGAKFNSVLEAMESKAGAAAAAFDVMSGSLTAHIARYDAAGERFRIAFGEMLSESESVKHAVASITDSVLELALQLEDPGTKAAFDSAFKEWVRDTGLILQGFAGIMRAHREARTEIQEFWHSMGMAEAAEPVASGWWENLVSRLGDAFTNVNKRPPGDAPSRVDVPGRSRAASSRSRARGRRSGGAGPAGGSGLLTGVPLGPDAGILGMFSTAFNEALEVERAGFEQLEAIELAGYQAREDRLKDHLDKDQELWRDHAATTADLQLQIADVFMSGTQSLITDMATAIGQGSDDLDEVLKRSLGGVMQNLGSMLISLGVAGVAAGTLGTAVPALKSITGGELGIAGGLAAIGVGAGLVAGGAALSGGASSAPDARNLAGSTGASAAPAPPVPTIDAPRGFAAGGAVTNVFEVSFHNVLPGSERRIARELRRYLRDGDLRLAG